MTYSGVHRDTQTCEPAKHHKKKIPDGQIQNIKSLEVGVQIPCCIYSEISKEKHLQRTKSAIHIARTYHNRKQNFVGQHFWARGYYVSTVGRDEEMIREYIRNQEKEDIRVDQLDLLK